MKRKNGWSPRPMARLLIFALSLFTLAGHASAEWKEKVLYSFQGGADGAAPVGGVVFGPDGTLYGATQFGGADNCSPMAACGTVYQLTPQKDGLWAETVLYVFKGKAFNDGEYPEGGLIADSSGNLYGTTAYGGSGNCVLAGSAAGCGTVFELSPPQQKGQAWTETILYSFPTAKQGYVPAGDLVFDASGNLYGSTIFGGGKGTTCDPFYQFCGAVFRLIAPRTKNGKWTERVLHSFAGGSDGAEPNGNLVLDSAGAVYGTTSFGGNEGCKTDSGIGCGTAFELKPPTKTSGAWTQEILHRFAEINDGATPSGGLIFDAAGALYGTTFSGSNVDGTIFKLTPTAAPATRWEETLLYTYANCGGNQGCSPSGLVFDNSGGLFGGAEVGRYHAGLIFSLKADNGSHSWQYNVEYSFPGPPGGAGPVYAFVFNSLGGLFGATVSGGTGQECQNGCGAVIELSP